MIQDKTQNELDQLCERLSIRLSRSYEEILPFIKILKDNWYDSIQSLKKLTQDDYVKMNIPHRVATSIQQEINSNIQPKVMPDIEQKQQQKQQISPYRGPKLNENQMKQMCKVLFNQLSNPIECKSSDIRTILETLLKIISNISKDPYELKFRKLKKSNKVIQKNIIDIRPCQNFIKNIGFIEDQESYQMHVPETHYLFFIQECLQVLIQKCHKKIQESNRFIDFSKVSQNFQTAQKNHVKKQNGQKVKEDEINTYFNQQKLSQMKYSDALDKLIQIRQALMSQPPKDRRLKIYHQKYENKNIQFQQRTFQEQFANSDDKTIANYWKQVIANNRKGQSFQSKRKLEFEQLIKQKIHKQTLIRIKLPNQLIIQAFFGPLEKLKDVFKFVSEIIIGDLYLFTTPPVKKMDKQMNRTLFDLDVVPMGKFYLGSNIEWYIVKSYVSIIQK